MMMRQEIHLAYIFPSSSTLVYLDHTMDLDIHTALDVEIEVYMSASDHPHLVHYVQFTQVRSPGG
jgi:hypothetical protein